MDKKDYIDLDFRPAQHIPSRIMLVAGLTFAQIILWQIIPIQLIRWMLIPLVCGLAWAASFGWRQALKAFRTWLDEMIEEEV